MLANELYNNIYEAPVEYVIKAEHMVRDKFQKTTQVRSRIPSYYQTDEYEADLASSGSPLCLDKDRT